MGKAWMRARPIVSYAGCWATELSHAAAVAVLVLLTTVVPKQYVSLTVTSILKSVWRLFCRVPTDVELSLTQQDSSGFFTSIGHDRTNQCVQRLVDGVCHSQELAPDNEIQICLRRQERVWRAFRGGYRQAGNGYKTVRLSDIIP